MTQDHLAKAIGVGVTSLAKLEAGGRRIDLDEAILIAAVLDVPIGDLIDDPSLSKLVRKLRDDLKAAIADEMRWQAEFEMATEQAVIVDEMRAAAAEHLIEAQRRVKDARQALEAQEHKEGLR